MELSDMDKFLEVYPHAEIRILKAETGIHATISGSNHEGHIPSATAYSISTIHALGLAMERYEELFDASIKAQIEIKMNQLKQLKDEVELRKKEMACLKRMTENRLKEDK